MNNNNVNVNRNRHVSGDDGYNTGMFLSFIYFYNIFLFIFIYLFVCLFFSNLDNRFFYK